MFKTKKEKGFTLVELLAVIVILAIILVIAVPKVMSIIEDSKKATLESTAKMIASAAEKAFVQNEILGKTEKITCESVAKINNVDYQGCKIEFDDNGKALVTIIGNGKFKGYNVCKGSKNNSNAVEDSCSLVTLTVNSDGGNLNKTYEEKYEAGVIVDLAIPTKEGYTFSHWEVSGNNAGVSNNKLTIGTTATEVTAVWTQSVYEISYNLDGGTASNKTSYTIETENFTLNNPTKTGYTFTGWTGSNGTTPSTSVTITKGATGNKEYTAKWTPIIYTITYNLDGGTANNPTSYTVETDTFTLETPIKDNYTFLGWTAQNGGEPITNITIEKGTIGNIEYLANWKIINVIPVFTYTGEYEIVDDNDNPITTTDGNWKIRFLTSGTLTIHELNGAANGIDVFLVGGGGGGGNGNYNDCYGSGGGGGYTTTSKNYLLTKDQDYTITIGSGGSAGGGRGGTSSAFNFSAAGGYGGVTNGGGGNGGSGGGGGQGGKGGSDGGGGQHAGSTSSFGGGRGQGTTTREFGEANAALYAGGGGVGSYGGGSGGGGAAKKAGIDNTGGGGGGGGANASINGAKGGSGIVIIRNAR